MSSRLSLPIAPREVYDNSILSTISRCPRLGLYEYLLNRRTKGKSYPLLFGSAYHKYREKLEIFYVSSVVKRQQDIEDVAEKIHTLALAAALDRWVDPPLEHKKAYLDQLRLEKTLEQAFQNWLHEKRQGYYRVIATETSFDLPLPSGKRFGGKFDQIVEWNNGFWVRDFKTSGRDQKNWQDYFDPHHQFTGYVWAAEQLTGRPIEGIIIDIIYNTKTKGPEHKRVLSSRSSGHIASWMEWAEYEMKQIDWFMEQNIWPMRSMACNDFGGCFFKGACQQNSWPLIEGWLEDNTMESVWDFMNPEDEEGDTM